MIGWDWRALQEQGRSIGLSRKKVWTLSIRELFHEFAIAVKQRRQELERDVRNAWLINVMEHGKRVGTLEKWLGIFRSEPRAPQPVTQQRMALEMIFGPNRGRPRTH